MYTGIAWNLLGEDILIGMAVDWHGWALAGIVAWNVNVLEKWISGL